MQRYWPIIMIVVLLAALAGIGLWYGRTNQDAVDQVLIELDLKAAEAGGITGSGFIEAVQVDIASELGGQIAAISVEEGDDVEAGDVLVKLDSDALDAHIRQAEAGLEGAEAQLARVKAGPRPEQIRQAEAAVAQAIAARDGAEQAWQDAIAARDNPQQLDMEIDSAETELDVARQQLAQALGSLKAAEEEKKQAEYGLDIAEHGKEVEVTLSNGNTVKQRVQLSDEARRQVGTQYGLAVDQWWQAWTRVNMAQAQVDGAETHLSNLRAEADNPLQLVAQVDAARSQYEVAVAAVESARAQLELVKAGPRDFQIRQAEARVQQAEARLQTLKVQLDKMTLRSPIDGTVIERVAHAGETATPSATLLRLGKLRPVTLTIYVPEPHLGQVHLGQTANARVDAFPNRTFEGEIVFIASEAEFTPKNVQTQEERASLVFGVRIKFPNEQGVLKPGMPADAVIPEED
jgi:HlyD family secretion protein